MRKWIKIFSAIALLFFVQRFCKAKTEGFALEKIRSDLTYREEWAVPPPSGDEKALLNQPFFYLGKGAQSYVFASQDGKVVIKFFRHSHMRPEFWMSEKKKGRALAKLNKDFKSYKIAIEALKEETGLLFLHLNKTKDLRLKLTIYDKIGVKHILDLDQMEFLVQKKAQLVYPQLDAWMRAGHAGEARRALSSLVEVLRKRMDLGIFDKDPDLNTNFGFINEQAVQIDIGRFRYTETKGYTKEQLLRITDNLRQWLRSKYPDLAEYLESLL